MTDTAHLVAQAVTLSSGTIAAMTSLRRYDKIEKAQNAFVEFCVAHPQFETWQDAWKKFRVAELG